MTVFNRIKEFLDNRPDPISGSDSTSAYRFWKDTDLSRTTAYRLYNDSSYIPTGEVLDKICSTYRIKPGLILDWKPDDGVQETNPIPSAPSKQSNPSANEQSLNEKSSKAGSTITVFPKLPDSA